MPEAHVSESKKKEVKYFADMLKRSSVVGVVNICNLPAPQFQQLRAALRDKVTLRVGKRRLMKLALEKVKSEKPEMVELESHLDGIMPALLFSDENPFMLARLINQNKSTAPAKAGQQAPNDIWVKAGPTPFSPGPIIGQLGMLRIKSQIEGGKVHISEDSLVVPEGEVISADAASILSRMGVEPMEIGLDLRVVYEKGEILTKNVLFIDEEECRNNFATAASWAFNLAFNAGYPTGATVPVLLATAHSDARALALSQDILTSDTAVMLLSKAARQGSALKAQIPETPAGTETTEPAAKEEPEKKEPEKTEPEKKEESEKKVEAEPKKEMKKEEKKELKK